MSKNILVQVKVPIQLFYSSKSEKLPALYSVAGRGLLWWGVVCGAAAGEADAPSSIPPRRLKVCTGSCSIGVGDVCGGSCRAAAVCW